MQSVRRRIAICESVVFAELDGEFVLLNLDTGIYFGLDAVGARIWSLLAEGADEDAVCERLLEEYEADDGQLRMDVASFLDLLTAKGLAQAESGG